jgi:putative ABC transport system permease protein
LILKAIQQLREAIILTFNFLRSNKLRSLLSVLGITIGIFCIVAILTATHSLEQNIRANLDKMGDKVVYIQKWPWGFGGNYEWWDYMNRPEATLKEYQRFVKEVKPDIIHETGFTFDFGNNKLKSPLEELTNVKINAVDGSFMEINQWKILLGRTFSEFELNKGKNVGVLGYNIAVNLFGGSNPVGRDIKLNGVNLTIIGVLEKQGNSLGGPQYDDVLVLPAKYATRFAKPNTNGVGSAIVVKGYDDIDLKRLDYEIKRVMRPMRRLKPKDKDDFAINKLTMFSDNLSQTFGVIDAVASVIGFFSLLVGGFGIANIMFVSVKERTSIIGLQKALGARRRFILSQFLFEAVALCIVGALIGIVLVIGLGFLATRFTDFTIYYSLGVFSVGLAISIFIGLIAGLAPANMASKLDPVVALRK